MIAQFVPQALATVSGVQHECVPWLQTCAPPQPVPGQLIACPQLFVVAKGEQVAAQSAAVLGVQQAAPKQAWPALQSSAVSQVMVRPQLSTAVVPHLPWHAERFGVQQVPAA